MQLSNIYDVSKTKLHGKMNSINTPIFRVFYVKTVWGHARAELIEAEDTIIKRGKEKEKKKQRWEGSWGGEGRGRS